MLKDKNLPMPERPCTSSLSSGNTDGWEGFRRSPRPVRWRPAPPALHFGGRTDRRLKATRVPSSRLVRASSPALSMFRMPVSYSAPPFQA